MPTLNFPTNPTLNQTYSFGGKTWVWNGQGWQLSASGAINNIPIGNITPASGAFTTLSANTFAANGITVLGNITGANLNANGNLSVAGNVNSPLNVRANVTATNFVTAGTLTAGIVSATGNVTGAYIIGDGSQLTNLPGVNYSNANVANYLPTYTGNLASLTGPVTTTGNLTGSNIVTSGLLTATGNITGGNLRTAGSITATGNITGGNLATGNIVSASINSSGLISAVGNITGAYIFGNGSQLTGLPATYSNANVAAYLPTYTGNLPNLTGPVTTTGNLTGGNVLTSGVISAAGIVTGGNVSTGNITAGNVNTIGNVQAAYFLGDGSQLTNLPAGNYSNANVANYLPTYTGNLVSLSGPVTTTSNITGGNLRTAGSITATGNITGGNVATGNITGGNAIIAGAISAAGNVAGAYILGDGSQLTNLPAGNYSNANVANYLPTYSGNLVSLAGPVTTTANITGGNLQTGGSLTVSGNITGGNVSTGNITAGNVSTIGNVRATYFLGDGSQLTNLPAGNYSNANVANYLPTYTGNLVSLSGPVTTTANVTGGNLRTAGSITATGNITGGNVATGNITAGNINSSGNVSGSYIFGNGAFLTGIDVGSSYSNANVAAYLPTYTGNLVSLAGPVTTTSNITGGNLRTAGTITATGNITGGNVATGNITAGNVNTSGTINASGNITGSNIETSGTVSSTANIIGGNLLTNGKISATGNITGQYFLGNGALLTGITISAGTQIVNGNSNVVVTGNGNVTVGVAGISNVTTFATTGVYVAGIVSATGNVIGNYFFGNGSQLTGVSASSVNAAALIGNTLSANVLYSSLTTVGTLANLSVVGNTTSGNLLTAGLISATGNITGSNLNITGGTLAFANANIIQTNPLDLAITGAYQISIKPAGGSYQWTFNNDGSLSGPTGLSTTGYVTATGNVTGGNVITTGLITASGNISGNNIFATTLISVSGNVIAANVNTNAIRPTSGELTITTASGNLNLQPAGNIVLANTIINSVAYPLQDTDAATKLYVDNMVSTGIAYHPPVSAATTTDLATATGGSITYAQPNGVANGIGATLTTTGSFNLIDTANVQTAGTRILVQNEGNTVFNGVYTWANSTVIVRATDADQYGPDSTEQLSINDYFFVQNGTVNKGSAFVVSAPAGTITFGTSGITFSQFSSSQTYTANINAGISLIGTQFNTKVDNNTTAFDAGGNIIVKASANLTTPNIGAATGTSLSLVGNAISGNVLTGGLISSTGNITSGNVTTSGLITATGNIQSGNVLTGGLITAGGNITGGNILTGGLVSATGNITGGNILTTGLISTTGNIAGGNILSNNYFYANGTPVPPGIIYTANTAPPTSPAPKVTDQWYDTASDVLYEYITDGTSTYWVDTTSPAFAGGVVANVAISGTLVPVANVTYDIGTNTVYFRNTYTQNLYTNNRLTASNMPAGAVIQTVMSTSLGGSATTGTSYSDIALANVVIQPSSANSKVLIIATGTSSFTPLATANLTASTQLVRTAASLQIQEYSANIAGGGVGGSSAVAFSYLDNPNTTSPVTYKMQQKISNSSSTLTSSNMWIIAMEIAVP